jgi:hypothetical protein
MVNDKIFDHRPMQELMSIVKSDFSKFDAEGLIDDTNVVKTIMYCNDRLGLLIREVREAAIPVENYKAKLPLDFEKLYYVTALRCSNSAVVSYRNPFDNNFDADVVYDAHLYRESLGCVDNYQVVIKREQNVELHNYGTWVQLEVAPSSHKFCHIDCPNKRKPGKYQVEIKGDDIITPFKSGMLYVMYIGLMKDADGNITFPFHPLITPFYEWSVKEKILKDAIFNSDSPNLGELLKLATSERVKAWLDAFNFTTEKPYGDYVKMQRKRELEWYNKYFKHFQ